MIRPLTMSRYATSEGHKNNVPSLGIAERVASYFCGSCLRDRLFFSLHREKISADDQAACRALLDSTIPDHLHPAKLQILETFSYEECHAEIVFQGNIYQIHFSKFETKETVEYEGMYTFLRIGGNRETLDTCLPKAYPFLEEHLKLNETFSLCFLQVSLYGHKIKESDEFKDWDPKNKDELSGVFLTFLHQLRRDGNVIDTLICHSLGSIVLDGLNNQENASFLPRTIILDRALTSVWKVGSKLYPTIVAHILYAIAYQTRWAADPEKSVLNFFKAQTINLQDREISIIVIEVKEDTYFSGKSAFDGEFNPILESHGVQASRITCAPNGAEFHTRSHHSLSLNYINDVNNPSNSVVSDLLPKLYAKKFKQD